MSDNKPTQEELGDFVSREILTCQTSLVVLLSNENIGGFDIENIVNFSKTNEDLLDEGYTQEQIDNDDVSHPYNEIFEWWLCTDWLLEKLEAEGQPILHTDYGDWWGRTCTGQAILLDNVIENIYTEVHKDAPF